MAEFESLADRVGAVVIGRNEGPRLGACLASLRADLRHVVYVDSGSTDDSLAISRAAGVQIVELDPGLPFTAARARNDGCRHLLAIAPQLSLVQFIDGDCELIPGWLADGVAFLDAHHDVAAVCGRRRERMPEVSVYNRLCDIEWNTPPGEANACGGDALFRLAPFHKAGGYRDDLIAGEEPELCLRLRNDGWRIWRLDRDMTLHDARMTRFGQWWRRALRSGHAYAEGAWLHGASAERFRLRETARILFWGLGLPILILCLIVVDPRFAWLLLLYPLQIARLALRKSDLPWRLRCLHASFLVIGKFPEALGVVRFGLRRLLGRRVELIEYK